MLHIEKRPHTGDGKRGVLVECIVVSTATSRPVATEDGKTFRGVVWASNDACATEAEASMRDALNDALSGGARGPRRFVSPRLTAASEGGYAEATEAVRRAREYLGTVRP